MESKSGSQELVYDPPHILLEAFERTDMHMSSLRVVTGIYDNKDIHLLQCLFLDCLIQNIFLCPPHQ